MELEDRVTIKYDSVWDLRCINQGNKVDYTSLKNHSSGAMEHNEFTDYRYSSTPEVFVHKDYAYNPNDAKGADELYLFRFDLEQIAKQYGIGMNVDKLMLEFNPLCKSDIDIVYQSVNEVLEIARSYQRNVLCDKR